MNIVNPVVQYLKESYREFKNVTWPTKRDVKRHTLLVIAISLFVALFLGVCDYFFSLGFNKLIK